MQQYLEFLKNIRTDGVLKTDRTGTGVKSIFGYQMRFNLSHGFPIVTTKKIHFKKIVYELLWFLQGNTNNNYLKNHGVNIWNKWALDNGDLGPIYGKQWRSWETPNGIKIDQIQRVIELIKKKPNSRRILVSSWNPADLPDENLSPKSNVRKGKAALPPCHTLFQFYTVNHKLSCMLTQRSADAFLGVPFNISSYALLTHMIAKQIGLCVGELIWSGGDCHIYQNHIEQVDLQLSRTLYNLPKLNIKRKPSSIFKYLCEDFELLNYKHHSSIRAKIAV